MHSGGTRLSGPIGRPGNCRGVRVAAAPSVTPRGLAKGRDAAEGTSGLSESESGRLRLEVAMLRGHAQTGIEEAKAVSEAKEEMRAEARAVNIRLMRAHHDAERKLQSELVEAKRELESRQQIEAKTASSASAEARRADDAKRAEMKAQDEI